jgi:thiamine biosynthesis lipoprotein
MNAEEVTVWQRIAASRKLQTAAEWHELSFAALGSPCRVRFAAPPSAAKTLPDAILQWVAQFEARYSRFIPTSLVSRITAAAGKAWVETDPETDQLLALCHEAHFITRGTFDPTALPLIRLWDWKANPAVLDQVAQLAVHSGATSVLVDFGHDVRVHGPPPDKKPAWHIGLEDPMQPGRCWTGLAANNQSVATSGDYLRNFVHGGKRYGHILDVRTGSPVANGCRAVSVIAPTCTLAGMLSTTAFVLGPEEGLRLLDATYQAAGCIVTESRTFASRRFYEFATK